MRPNKYERILDARRIQYVRNEGYPELFYQLDVRNVYYLPEQRVVIDTYRDLEENVSRELNLSGFQVFEATSEQQMTDTLNFLML